MAGKDVVVVGGGLAGLSCAFELVDAGQNVRLFEARDVVGGRTSSWLEDGMPVESGLHRFLGYFTALINLLHRSGVDIDEIICWEDQVEIRVPDGGPSGILGLSPYRPMSTLAGAFGNNDLLDPLDKMSLLPFLVAGIRDYSRRPEELDRESVAGYARRHRVRPRTLDRLLRALTAGIYFLPPERFSAYHFFGLVVPGLPRLHRMRLGAFNGGMTDVMAEPIADAVRRRGGEIRTDVRVEELRTEGGRVTGVRTDDGEIAEAANVVLASSLGPAKRLLEPAVGHDPWFAPMLGLPTTPSVTVQFELDAPIMDVDRTTFGPGVALACFAEQSRTTFQHAPGRLSVILSPPEQFVGRNPDDVVKAAIAEAPRVGLDLENHVARARVIELPEDFHTLEPGHRWRSPTQATPVPGLTLAGDYTRQRFTTTMEGAVISGRLAAEQVVGPGGSRSSRKDKR